MSGTIHSTFVHESTPLIIGFNFQKFNKLVYYLILKNEKKREKQIDAFLTRALEIYKPNGKKGSKEVLKSRPYIFSYKNCNYK